MITINLKGYNRLLAERGYSTWALAKKAKLSWNTVKSLENRGETTEKTFKKVIEAFSVPARDLLMSGGSSQVDKETQPEGDKSPVGSRNIILGEIPFDMEKVEEDPFAQAVADLREIFNSKDPIIVRAIINNLFSFKRAVRREEEIRELKFKIQNLASQMSALEEKVKDEKK